MTPMISQWRNGSVTAVPLRGSPATMNVVTPPARSARPAALAAQGLPGLLAGEGECEEEVRGEERFDEGDLALAERYRAEHHARDHQADAAEPARHPHQVEQQPRGEEVAQGCLLGHVLLEHEPEAEATGRTHGEHQNQNRHAAYLDRWAGLRGALRRL